MRWFVMAVALLLGCGDDGMTPDAGPDASNEILPIAVTFEAVGTPTTPDYRGFYHRGPDGTVYARNDLRVETSTDLGVTWTPRGTVASGFGQMAITPTAVIAGSGQQFYRSLAGTTTFNSFPVPTTVPAMSGGHLAATGTALWFLVTGSPGSSGTPPPTLWRSINDGTSFTSIALPATFAGAALIEGGDGKLYLVGDDHAYRTTDGTSWEDLGAFAEVMQIVGTQQGTALLWAREAGQFVLYHRAAAASTWTPDAPVASLGKIYQRPNGELVQIGPGGQLATSVNQGMTWTPVITNVQVSILDALALDGAILAETTTGAARLVTGSTTWSVVVPPPFTGAPSAGLDISFAANGRAVVGTATGVSVSDDSGATWRAGAYLFDSAPARAVAVTPDGSRIFVGTTSGRWTLLSGNGDAAVDLGDVVDLPNEEHFIQAEWRANNLMLVTTSSDDNTKGNVFNFDPGRIGQFQPINPFLIVNNPGADDPTAGFHGIGLCPSGSTFGLLIASRQWTGINAYRDHLFLQGSYSPNSPFDHIDPPVGFGQALTISCANSETVALLYVENRIYLGGWHKGWHAVEENTLPGTVRSAKLAPDRRLWAITDQGVFRSTAPIVIP